jgi:hypothetical protein
MDFQQYWDQQIDRLELIGTPPGLMNKLYSECFKAWKAALTNTVSMNESAPNTILKQDGRKQGVSESVPGDEEAFNNGAGW